MPDSRPAAIISYSREDSEFALRLAQDLRAAGASVWIDQLDIKPGTPWDNAIEDALIAAPQMLVILSPTSVKSENVRDEIAYALKQGKIVIPVLYLDCVVPLRLERKQHIDFRTDYARGLGALLDHLRIEHPDQSVLDQVAKDEAARRAAWLARDAEARRLAEMRERERLEDLTRQKEAAERIAIEEAERKALEEFRKKAHEDAERKAAEAEVLRREAEERKKREQDLLEQQQREDALRKAREEAERKAAEERERKAREEAARKAAEERERKAREEAERKAAEERERKAREEKKERKSKPVPIPWNPKLIRTICVLVLLALVVDLAYHHWFSRAGTKWIALKSGVNTSLDALAGSSDGKILYTCGASGQFLSSTDGGATWVNRSTGSLSNCNSLFSTSDGKHIWAATMASKVQTSNDGGASWQPVDLPVPADTASTSSSSPSDMGRQMALAPVPGITETSPGIFTSKPGSLVKVGSLFDSTASSVSKPVPHIIDAIFGTPDGVFLWAVGNFGGIYAFNGANWNSRVSNTPADLFAISGTSDGRILMAVGANGAADESIDAGLGWWHYNTRSNFALRSVFVSSNAKILCAVGDVSGVFISTDKGVTWTEGENAAGGSFHGVFGTPDGKRLWAVATSGIIIQSQDSGVTWKLRQSGTKYNLNAIFGTSDGKHLWAVGDNGTILESKSSVW